MQLVKTLFVILVSILLFTSQVWSVTYYVSQGGAETCVGDYTVAAFNAGGSPFDDLAGDTVELCGAISTRIVLTHGGSSGNEVTLINYDSDTQLNGGIDLAGYDYIWILGQASDDQLKIQNVSDTWIDMTNSTYCKLQYIYLYNADNWDGIGMNGGTNYNQFLNLEFADAPLNGSPCGAGTDCTNPRDLMDLSGSYNYLYQISFGQSSHSAMGPTIYYARYNVIKECTFNNAWHSNIDFHQADMDNNVFEDNIIKNAGSNRSECVGCKDTSKDEYNHKGISMGGDNNIIRGNKVFNNGKNGLPANTTPGGNYWYNNTFYKNVRQIFSNGLFTLSSNLFKNNIIDTAYSDEAESVFEIYLYNNDASDAYFDTNNIDMAAGEARYESSTYDSIAELNALGDFSNNNDDAPGMTDPDNEDFTLDPASDMIDAGTWLTLIDGTTTSTSFFVDDVYYFFEGISELGLAGDSIKTESGQTGVIESINYGTHQITLTSSITVVNNEGIALLYNGEKPDIGAKEYGETPPDPCENFVPTNGAEGIAIDTLLTFDFLAGETFDIYADDTDCTTLVCDDDADGSCDPGDFANNDVIYWKVHANTANQDFPSTGCFTFTTVQTPATLGGAVYNTNAGASAYNSNAGASVYLPQ